MYMSLDSLQLFGFYNVHGIVMVMDLRNVFRMMVQVGFIDGIGLKYYGTGYVWGLSNLKWTKTAKLCKSISDSSGRHRRRPYCRGHRRSRSSVNRKRNDAKGKKLVKSAVKIAPYVSPSSFPYPKPGLNSDFCSALAPAH
ncbi:hypothetical protein [Absidia glauca]|uniref:Uncharacterized protein n=1 Tax=Absidia glauca TaxID=4829 RepID=A0A163M4S4_ABSGL|nr:hypothetical protein [Absidia glauca]